MRDLIVTENITVDGVIDASEDWFSPAGRDDVDQSDQIAAIAEQREAADAFLTGRVTFEAMRSYWPKQVDDRTGITDELNRIQKYVVSATLADPGWQNSTVLSGDWRSRVAALREQPGKEIGVTGSIRLCHALIEAGLVDEYRLFVYPVVQQGVGKVAVSRR